MTVTQPDHRDEPVLPEQTGDEDPVGWNEPDTDNDDEWLLGEVPPHWQ